MLKIRIRNQVNKLESTDHKNHGIRIYHQESQLCVRYLLQRKIYQNILKNYKSLKTKLHVHSLTQKNSLKEENKENKKLKLKLDQSNNLLFKLIPNKLLRNSKKH